MLCRVTAAGVFLPLMLPPSLILFLASLLAVRWGIRLVKKFELRNVFTFLSRLYFAVIYGYITIQPPDEDVRFLFRIGLFVLFADEAVNWISAPFFAWASNYLWPRLKRAVSKLHSSLPYWGKAKHD